MTFKEMSKLLIQYNETEVTVYDAESSEVFIKPYGKCKLLSKYNVSQLIWLESKKRVFVFVEDPSFRNNLRIKESHGIHFDLKSSYAKGK